MSIGVLVMAYGTPTTPDDVGAYYARIRRGRAPTSEQLADLVRRYNAIGGTSPLATRSADQVRGLTHALQVSAPGQFDVRFGSKYEPPLLEETAASFRDDGVTTVVGLVLAPHSSSMSTDQYMSRARDALGEDVRFITIGAWWDVPGFLELIAARVNEARAKVPDEHAASTEVLFSAHSLPEKILTTGDTYPEQLRESARRAAAIAGVARWDTAWQSAGRTTDSWLGPDILQVLRSKRELGVTDIVSCPIGFVSDNLEVLFDIDIEAQGVAHDIGLNLVRTASLNDDPALMTILANRVLEASA